MVDIQEAIDKLIENMNQVEIPLGVLYQFMPAQYLKVRDGILEKVPNPCSWIVSQLLSRIIILLLSTVTCRAVTIVEQKNGMDRKYV